MTSAEAVKRNRRAIVIRFSNLLAAERRGHSRLRCCQRRQKTRPATYLGDKTDAGYRRKAGTKARPILKDPFVPRPCARPAAEFRGRKSSRRVPCGSLLSHHR